ncbi:MAG: response regulator [Mariprofundaceae bacterium]|nr:response regulator [Mariprofundaceae bacterium]
MSIDDEDAIRELSACILEDMKLNVLLAKDGVEGLDVLQDHLNDVSLVLLDMTMPRMNGKQFYHHMQAFASHIPVVILSGYTEIYMQTHFMEDSIESSAHPLSFVEKPFSPEMLRLLVEKQLSGKRAPVV